MSGRPWTPEEHAAVRAEYGRTPSRELARRFGRTRGAVMQRAKKLGCHDAQHPLTPADGAWMELLYDRGLTDAEIARGTGVERHKVAGWRLAVGLPVSAAAVLRTRRAAQATQFKRLGLSSTYDLRRRAWSELATARGLPADLSPREVQIVAALATGPRTKEEIARAVGMKYTRGKSRRSLKSSRKRAGTRGSYMADLAHRGLVTSTWQRHGGGRGQRHYLYALTPAALQMLAAAPGKDGAA